MPKKIQLLLILIILTIFLNGCSTKADENIICEQEEYAWQQRILNENENLTIQNIELQLQINQLKMDKIMIEYNLTKYYEKYLWKENYYYFYPTSCENPKEIFTVCKSGCDFEFKCDTNSMNPLFWCNVMLTFADCTSYSIGDIILFKDRQYGYDYIIHQIIDINNVNITTKGFNNNGVDNFTTNVWDIEGKVIKIEY